MSVVTVAEVRLFLRVIHTDDDALLQALIDAAEDGWPVIWCALRASTAS